MDMIRTKTTLVVLIAITLATSPIWQTGAQTMDEVVLLAIKGNPRLIAIRDTIVELKAKGPGDRLFEKFELSAAGSWEQNSLGGEPGASISISGPLLPQLSLTANYDFNDGTSSLNATIMPFAKSQVSVSWTAELSARELHYNEESARVRSRAENFYVSMVIALARQQVAAARFALAELPFKGSAFKYESGVLSYKKYKESVQAYQLSLQNLINAERSLVSLKRNALEVFGSAAPLETASSWSITENVLLDRSKKLEAALASATDPQSSDLALIQAELDKLERDQASTFGWEPKFNLAASAESSFSTVQASFGITFSLDQIKADEKARLAVKIQAKKQEAERKRLDVSYAVRLLRLQCDTLKEGIAIHTHAVKLADGAYAEANVQYKAGALDKESLEAARLDTIEARLSLTQAAGELMTSWQDLHVYFLNVSVDGGK